MMIATKLRARLLSGTMVLAGMATATGATAQEVPAAPAQATAPQVTPPASDPAPQTAADQPVGSDIVVVANRYQATDLQMRSQNTVNVLSAQDLAHTAVHNVAEALGLLPGVNVMNTGSSFAGGVDGASRGEGFFVSVRGLNSEYNVNLINGVNVAQGNPYSRGVQLSLLPPSGLQTIVLNKTSRADMDGDAIGGTIDFRTPTAFDSPDRYSASATVGGRLESRARDYDRSGLGYSAAGDVSAKFGAGDQFGFYASGFYDRRSFANSLVGGIQESGCCDNGYDFAVQGPGTADHRQNSAPGYDPAKNLIMTGANFGVSEGHTERFGGNASFDWHMDDGTTVYLRGTYAEANTVQNSHLSQVVASNKQDGSDGQPIGTTGLYQPILGNAGTRFYYETNPEKATLGTVQMGGEHRYGNLTVSPNIFYTWGENARPNHIEVAARTQDAGGGGAGLAYGGTTLFSYANNYPQPLLTPTMLSAISNIPGMPAFGGAPEETIQTSEQHKVGMKLDFRYDFDGGVLNYIKFGGKYQDSTRNATNRDYTTSNSNVGYGLPGATTFGDLGIINGTFKSAYPGLVSWAVPDIDQAALFALFNKLGGATMATIDTCGSNAINSYNCNTQKASERVAAVYAMAQMTVGDLEIIPGVRYEHTDIHNIFWLTPQDANGNSLTGAFSSNDAEFNRVLPSLFLNYRPNRSAVYRASIWTSYTRPPFLQLGGGASTSVGVTIAPGTNIQVQTTTITKGNPNLKSIGALNLDASGEWDTGQGGHLSLAGFYKRLSNYIYDGGSNAGVISATGVGTITRQPVNGGSGTVYGVEIAARQKFSAMPAPLDGLGIAGNFTYQHTRVDVLGDGTRYDRIQNAPDFLGNAQLFFERGPFGFDINYDYSGRYVSVYDTLGFNATWDDVWVRAVGRLDLHAGYALTHRLKLDASISNVLKANSYWAHIGKDTYTISDIVNSGSTSLLTLTYKM